MKSHNRSRRLTAYRQCIDQIGMALKRVGTTDAMRWRVAAPKMAASYVQRLLNDQDVQERVGRAVRSGREVYGRARGKKAAEAIQAKKLQQRIFESLSAAREAWVAVEQPPRRASGACSAR